VGQAYQIGVQYSSSTQLITIFVNGTKVSSDTDPSQPLIKIPSIGYSDTELTADGCGNGNPPVFIGTSNGGLPLFDGYISNVMFFRTSQDANMLSTASQSSLNALAEISGNECYGAWTLLAGSLADGSGNGFTLTVNPT
jgi:hypothetical protein